MKRMNEEIYSFKDELRVVALEKGELLAKDEMLEESNNELRKLLDIELNRSTAYQTNIQISEQQIGQLKLSNSLLEQKIFGLSSKLQSCKECEKANKEL